MVQNEIPELIGFHADVYEKLLSNEKALLFLLMLIFKSWSIHHLQLFLENKTVKISGSNTCQIVYLSSFVLMICAAKNAILCEFSWIEARLLKDNLISNYVLIQIKDADVLTWHA